MLVGASSHGFLTHVEENPTVMQVSVLIPIFEVVPVPVEVEVAVPA
jgi:hypothetical protein